MNIKIFLFSLAIGLAQHASGCERMNSWENISSITFKQSQGEAIVTRLIDGSLITIHTSKGHEYFYTIPHKRIIYKLNKNSSITQEPSPTYFGEGLALITDVTLKFLNAAYTHPCQIPNKPSFFSQELQTGKFQNLMHGTIHRTDEETIHFDLKLTEASKKEETPIAGTIEFKTIHPIPKDTSMTDGKITRCESRKIGEPEEKIPLESMKTFQDALDYINTHKCL